MSCSEGCTGGCGSLECGEGAAGLNGLNSFTVTTADFNQPDFGDPAIIINVSALGQATGTWAQVGQRVFIGGAGYFAITAITATTMSVTVPDADTETFNHSLAASGATVAFPKGVSPGGLIGPQGPAGSYGVGIDGTTILGYERDGGTFSNTSFMQVRGPYAIPADSWESIGDTVRVTLIFTAPVSGSSDSSNYIESTFKMRVGGVDIVAVPVGPTSEYKIKSFFALNAIKVQVDLVARSMSPFILEAVPSGNLAGMYTVGDFVWQPSVGGTFISGLGLINATDGVYYDAAALSTLTIDPTVSNNFDVQAKHSVFGTGGGAATAFACPFSKIELLKK